MTCNVLFDTGTGNRKQLLNVSEIAKNLGDKKCSALLSLHAVTGCDTTSAQRGIGKQKPMKVLDKNPQFEHWLEKIGEEWTLNEQLIEHLEHFVCSIYGYPASMKIDELRLTILSRKCFNDNKLDPTRNVD